MLNKVNNLLLEQYQNFYMNSNNKQQSDIPKKQFRSFQEFNNFCKKVHLLAQLINDKENKNDKFITINLFLCNDNKKQKFQYYYKNNQQYFKDNYKQFKAIQDFLNKYIITKTGQDKYPICIIG